MVSLNSLPDEVELKLKNKLEIEQEKFEEIRRVCSLSDYFCDYLSSDESTQLIESGDLFRAFAANEIRKKFSLVGSENLDGEIRRIRNQHIARIIFRDLTRRADLVETTRDLSDLADSCIQTVLDYHYRQNVLRFGNPIGESGAVQQMCVLALGKLGGTELNVSSDIDLVFLYGESGYTDGDSQISNQEFFVRTSRQLIKSLDAMLDSGFVFRVDMRLRPYGESGALILGRSAIEKYFLEQGRDWERYAFIKARAVAGDLALGSDFLTWLRPFVYRKHLDYGAVESLRDMKQLINNEVERKELHDDLKLGPGGIREVEFFVQVQQLIWGGNKPILQERRLLVALSQLAEGGYLDSENADTLREAYIFLRNSEHAIQAEKDRQSQRLPTSDLGKARLANAMGFDSYGGYESQLQLHRDQVSSFFASVMSSNVAEREIQHEGARFWVSIWQDPKTAESLELLSRHNFGDVNAIADLLVEFQLSIVGLQDIATGRIQRFMPVLLSLCAREEEPDETIRRLLMIIDSILRRSTYIVFLLENLDATMRLVHLCAMSEWISEQVSQYPVLMYGLNDRSIEEAKLSPEEFRRDLEDALNLLEKDDLEGQMDTLRRFKHAAVLKVAIFELLDLNSTMRASDQLTSIAELILDKSTELAFRYLIGRHGEPCDRDGKSQGECMAIVAYGKLGGIELAYGSDLDLVFLHDADIQGETSGPKSVPNTVFFSRLGQRIVHILSSLTSFGTLYEVDLRLRPDGNKGPLVGTFNAYERYLQGEAWTWEHQALVRARYVAGNPLFKSRFEEIREHILARTRDVQVLKQDVSEMRERMRAHLDSESNPPSEVDELLVSGFDLKHGSGAIIDIEFLVQYLILANCHRHPGLVTFTDKVRLIDSLAEHKLLLEEEAVVLHRAYVAYRAAVHYTWLGGQMSSYEQLHMYREQVVQIWQKYFGAA